MKKNYETVFIITPVLSEDQMKSTVDKFVDILKEKNSDIINTETWGLKKLAYTINHKNSGYYAYIEFATDVNVINELETELNRDEKILRFLTVALDKHSLAYNDKRRTGIWKKDKTQTEETKEN